MDSMRHLSSSLPRRRNEQSHHLLSDFKAAALSVTNLYKTAAAENKAARDAGYQDALDDLLAFLDKENMGLMDGEGWRVRRWATERLDDAPKASEDEDEGPRDDAVETRSSSPEVQRRPAVQTSSSEPAEETEPRRTSEPPQYTSRPPAQEVPATTSVPVLNDFTFSSGQSYPSNHDRADLSAPNHNGMDVDSTTSSASAPNSTSTVRITPKPSRSRLNRNRDTRAPGATFNFNLGSGAGNKRKIPYPDFFDISGTNSDGNGRDGKDGGGRGGKRGRHV